MNQIIKYNFCNDKYTWDNNLFLYFYIYNILIEFHVETLHKNFRNFMIT